ncbi:MAG: N-acetylmuramoyl-L-alanine amidase [Oscillospiraceae bacterium]|nr:N-acetylmuramoyl-L-alanine amidase [Oscillospiraceae bacterium]
MAKRRRIRWDRILMVFGPLLLILILLFSRCGSSDDRKKPAKEPKAEQSSTIAEESGAVPDVTVPVPDQTEPAMPVDVQTQELVVVIDPGHGGNDGGALNDANNPTRFEKDDNLNLALAVEQAFKKYPYIRTIMTRTDDSFVELNERCRIANEANADFFISLHRNSAVSGDGVEIWINNDSGGDNTMDKMLAQYIMELLDEVGVSNNRGIKSGFRNSDANRESNNYYVNRYTQMPSCLIEMGFMTSDVDNQNFDAHLQEYADAIAAAVNELVTDRRLLSTDIQP